MRIDTLFRFAICVQLVIATGCMILFEQYVLNNGQHPNRWQEPVAVFAYLINWLLLGLVAIAAAMARRQLWHRIVMQ